MDNSKDTRVGGELIRGTEFSVSSCCTSTHVEHVHSEGVEARDNHTAREGSHYAVRSLPLILIRWDKNRRLFSVAANPPLPSLKYKRANILAFRTEALAVLTGRRLTFS